MFNRRYYAQVPAKYPKNMANAAKNASTKRAVITSNVNIMFGLNAAGE